MATKRIEVWVCVDEGGDYACGNDRDGALDDYVDAIDGTGPTRLIRVLLDVPLPTPVTLTGAVPAEGAATLTAVEG